MDFVNSTSDTTVADFVETETASFYILIFLTMRTIHLCVLMTEKDALTEDATYSIFTHKHSGEVQREEEVITMMMND